MMKYKLTKYIATLLFVCGLSQTLRAESIETLVHETNWTIRPFFDMNPDVPGKTNVLGDVNRDEPVGPASDPFAIDLAIRTRAALCDLYALFTNHLAQSGNNNYADYINLYSNLLKRVNHIGDYSFDTRKMISTLAEDYTNEVNRLALQFNTRFVHKNKDDSANPDSGEEIWKLKKFMDNVEMYSALTIAGKANDRIIFTDDGIEIVHAGADADQNNHGYIDFKSTIDVDYNTRLISEYDAAAARDYLCLIPAPPYSDSSSKIPTTMWVHFNLDNATNSIMQLLTNYVTIAGSHQDISGDKTFSGTTRVNLQPVNDFDVVNKMYVDSRVDDKVEQVTLLTTSTDACMTNNTIVIDPRMHTYIVDSGANWFETSYDIQVDLCKYNITRRNTFAGDPVNHGLLNNPIIDFEIWFRNNSASNISIKPQFNITQTLPAKTVWLTDENWSIDNGHAGVYAIRIDTSQPSIVPDNVPATNNIAIISLAYDYLYDNQ